MFFQTVHLCIHNMTDTLSLQCKKFEIQNLNMESKLLCGFFLPLSTEIRSFPLSGLFYLLFL